VEGEHDRATIVMLDGRALGPLCWQVPPRSELEEAGLGDLPADLIDIDVLIGDPEARGHGVAPTALEQLCERLRARGAARRAGSSGGQRGGARRVRQGRLRPVPRLRRARRAVPLHHARAGGGRTERGATGAPASARSMGDVSELSPLDVLVRCPPFARADDASLHALAAIAVWRRFEVGAMVFWADAEPEGLHVVASGAIKVFVVSPQTGREVILTTEHPFHTVAELPSFDGGAYPANAQAVEVTVTLFLEQARFEQVLEARPTLTRHLLRTLGTRLRRLVGLVEQLSFQEVVHRLAAYLLERSEAGLPYALETNAVIGARIGTVPELVSRNLSRLQQLGAVTMEVRTVVAVDRDALVAWVVGAGR